MQAVVIYAYFGPVIREIAYIGAIAAKLLAVLGRCAIVLRSRLFVVDLSPNWKPLRACCAAVLHRDIRVERKTTNGKGGVLLLIKWIFNCLA